MKGMKKATTPAPAAPVSDASARDEGPAPKRLCRDHDGNLSESAFELYGQLQRRVCATPACTETWIIDDGCEEDLANLYCSICAPSRAAAAVAAEVGDYYVPFKDKDAFRHYAWLTEEQVLAYYKSHWAARTVLAGARSRCIVQTSGGYINQYRVAIGLKLGVPVFPV